MNFRKFSNLFIVQSIVFALLLVNALRPDTIPDILILVSAMVMPLFLSAAEIPAYIIGFATMGTGVQVAYIALSCLIFMVFKTRGRLHTLSLISILVFIIYELIHMIFFKTDEIIEFIRYVAVYALLFISMFTKSDNNDKKRIVDSYIYGNIISIVHVFLETLAFFKGDVTNFFSGNFRLGYAEKLGAELTMSADPNLLGQGCSFTIVLGLTMLLLGYIQKRYFISMGFCLIAGAFTLSKTFLLSLALIVLLVLLFAGSWNSIKVLKMRILIIAVTLIGGIALISIYPDYLKNIWDRFILNELTTGRLNSASIYFDALLSSVIDCFFGLGLQNVGEKIGFTGSPHAAIIEVWACFGIVGMLALIILIIKSISFNMSDIKAKAINFIPLIVFTILVQSTQLFRLRDRVFILLVMIAVTGISTRRIKTNETKEKGSGRFKFGSYPRRRS